MLSARGLSSPESSTRPDRPVADARQVDVLFGGVALEGGWDFIRIENN